MANLDLSNISEEYREIAPKECAIYLFNCLPKEKREALNADWKKAGGISKCPWWKWCMDNITVDFNSNSK